MKLTCTTKQQFQLRLSPAEVEWLEMFIRSTPVQASSLDCTMVQRFLATLHNPQEG